MLDRLAVGPLWVLTAIVRRAVVPVLHRELAVHRRDQAKAALLMMLVDVQHLLGHERRRFGGASFSG
eukprot:7046366-Prymnesium_polylepis.1